MGKYLNPNNAAFIDNLHNDIYVDKSMIIEQLNNLIDKSESKFICVSRPRRFGKTMATNLISAFYSKGCDSRNLFSSLKIAQTPSWDKNLNKFNVIKLDVQELFSKSHTPEELVPNITSRVNKELIKCFPDVEINIEDELSDSLENIFTITGEQFVIIMDEYDVMVREQVSDIAFKEYLKFLNGLFKNSTLKPAIHLAYLTGILPIVRDKIESKLNEFIEYSMIEASFLSGFIGFTENEVQDLCHKYNMDFAECKKWYNGYKIGNTNSIYTPRSIVQAMTNNKFGYYWTRTGSYKNIQDYIKLNFDGIKEDIIAMISGKSVKVDITTFLNTMESFNSKDDVYTYLIHLGYLAYNEEKRVCWIPNNEIRQEWVNAIKNLPDYSTLTSMIKDSEVLLEETLSFNETAVAKALNNSHIIATNPKTYNNEGALQSAICLAYLYAYNYYTVIQELPTGKGYADVVFIPVHPSPDKPALIIELKNKQSTETALKQIKEKQYGQNLSHYTGNMLFVGINYDPETKEHECKIEKFQK